MWLPGFAYHFEKNGMMWHKLLKGRTARVVVTMDSSPFIERIMLGDFTNEIRKGILGFSGLSTSVTKIGYMHSLSDTRKARLVKKMEKMGKRAR
jgi:putative NADPH-quinone reductase